MKINNINEKFFKKARALGLSLCLTANTLSTACLFSNFYLGRTVKVSESVRDSINDNYPEFVNENISQDEIEYNRDNNIDILDKKYNTAYLKNLVVLTIDGSVCGDLDILDYTPNLEAVYIKHFECLNSKDIERLQKLKKINKLYINVGYDYLLKNPSYRLDLSVFDDIDEVYLTYSVDSYPRDICNYIYYNLVKDYYNTNRPNILDFCMEVSDIDDVIRWDKEFDKIISEIPLSDCHDDEEKLVQIAKYINTNYEYDNEVAANLSSGDINKAYFLGFIYNQRYVDSFLSDYKTGVCCNFACFVSILCYRAGIECYFIKGFADDGENEIGHAWNFVNIDNNYYIVDTTKFENESGEFVYNDLDKYSSIKDSAYYDFVVDKLLTSVNSDDSLMYIDDNDYMLSVMEKDDEKEDILYFNNDEKWVFGINDDSSIIIDGLFMLSTVIASFGYYYSCNYRYIDDYEEEEEEKKLTR